MIKWILCIILGALVMAFGPPFGAIGIIAGMFGLFVLSDFKDESHGADVANDFDKCASSAQTYSRELIIRDGHKTIGLREITVCEKWD